MSDPVSRPADPARRRVLRAGAGLGAAALGGALPSSALAQALNDHRALEVPINTRDAERVEVLEFFWFGCPHCYAFEPALERWAESRPDYIDFVREAPPLNRSWETHSRAFYAAEALGVIDGFFTPMFDRIHRERRPMRDPKRVAAFAESLDLGVEAEKFATAMRSFSVETALGRSVALAQGAGISGVPSMVVNGRYVVTSSLAGSHEGMIAAIERLAAEEHAAS